MKNINLLIVEGEDDKIFFTELCKVLKIENVVVSTVGGENGAKGKPALLNKNAIEVTLNSEEKDNEKIDKALLICDADFEIPGVQYSGFEKTKKALGDLIESLQKEEKHKEKTFKFFIIPDDKVEGNLETLFLESVSDPFNSTLGCVDSYLSCISNQGSVQLQKIKSDKTKALALLLAIGCDDGVRGVGGAAAIYDKIKSAPKYWNFESEKLVPIKKFLIENLGVSK